MASVFGVSAHAQQRTDSSRWSGAYTDDVKKERPTAYVDLPEVPEAPKPSGPLLKDRIFDQKLTNEIRNKYEDRFGPTQAMQIRSYSNRFNYSLYGTIDPSRPQVSASNDALSQQSSTLERRFGNYMASRLLEYHVDSYFRNEPGLKPAYQIKENISKLNVSFKPGWKFMSRYSLSSKSMEMKLVNPYVESGVLVEFGGTILPTSNTDTTVKFGREIDQGLRTELRYKIVDGRVDWVNMRKLTPQVETSLTTGMTVHNHGYTQREKLILAGVGWSWW